MDEDTDGKISWQEYLADAFGDSEEMAELDESDKVCWRESFVLPAWSLPWRFN